MFSLWFESDKSECEYDVERPKQDEMEFSLSGVLSSFSLPTGHCRF